MSSVGVIRERNEVFAIGPYVSMDDSEQEDELATPTQQIAKLIAVTWQHISIPLTYQAENVGERFKVLVESWQEQTRFMSSSTDIAMHPSYQQIIGLGKPALPLIMEELQKNDGHWFWALKAISGIDPVPLEERGQFQKMAERWLTWGREEGLL